LEFLNFIAIIWTLNILKYIFPVFHYNTNHCLFLIGFTTSVQEVSLWSW